MIGQRYSWLVNASTCHPGHFVGTNATIGLTRQAGDVAAHERLHDFVSRYAAPGATVSVYCLHDSAAGARPAAKLSKSSAAPFQPPGCHSPNTNGIDLYPFVKVPIEQSQLTPSCLERWEQAVADVKQHLNLGLSDAAEEEAKVDCGFVAARTRAKTVALRQLQAEMRMSDDESPPGESNDHI